MFKHLEELGGETQIGFKHGMGLLRRYSVLNFNSVIQNYRDQCQEVFLGFINSKKDFEIVKQDTIVKYLVIKIIKIYIGIRKHRYNSSQKRNQTQHKFLKYEEYVKVCILSPIRFNLWFENIFSEALEGVKAGVKMNS